MHSFETRVTQSVAIVPANAPNLALFIPLARERADVCGLGRQVSDNDHDALDRCDSDWEGLLPWQVRRVRDYIEAGLHGRVSLSAAAGQARLSPGYFSRCFRRAFGVTFSRFVAGKRVERAQRLMLERAGKLCQIALACGFADQAHFTRTFGSLTGCTPARWRRQVTLNRLPI